KPSPRRRGEFAVPGSRHCRERSFVAAAENGSSERPENGLRDGACGSPPKREESVRSPKAGEVTRAGMTSSSSKLAWRIVRRRYDQTWDGHPDSVPRIP